MAGQKNNDKKDSYGGGDTDHEQLAKEADVPASPYAPTTSEKDREIARLRFALEAIKDTFDDAVLAHDTRGRGGMHVPYHGDFASASPSVVSQMRWWSRRFDRVLNGEDW